MSGAEVNPFSSAYQQGQAVVSETTLLVDSPSRTARAAGKPRALTEADAVEIWIARWLRMRPKDLMGQYGCDSRRLYDIWWGQTFPASRARAQKTFQERYPGAADRTDFGYRKIPRGGSDPRQTTLFDRLR